MSIETFILLGLVNALAIVGLYNAADEGMMLYRLRTFYERFTGEYWGKPILGCYKCMASVWGGLPAVIYMAHEHCPILVVIVVALVYTCMVSALAAVVKHFD